MTTRGSTGAAVASACPLQTALVSRLYAEAMGADYPAEVGHTTATAAAVIQQDGTILGDAPTPRPCPCSATG